MNIQSDSKKNNNNNNNPLDGERYLKEHNLDIYFGDAVKQLLWSKQIGGKVDPSEFLHQYFTCVKKGEHVLLRDFAYVKATPWNRFSFLKIFRQTFQHLSSEEHNEDELYACTDLHSLVCLLCPDFSRAVVQKSVTTGSMNDEKDSMISFTNFMACLHVEFYYLEFSDELRKIFHELVEEQNLQGKPSVPSKSIFRRIKERIYNDRLIFSPPMTLVEAICGSETDLQYHSFIVSLNSKFKELFT